MSGNDLRKKFLKVKTSLELKRLIISLFNENGYEKTRKGIEDFKRDIESNIPSIEQLVINNTQKTGNGIIEVLEDYLGL